MKLVAATLIAALLCTAGPALAQTPAPGAQQAPQHMPGTPEKPGQASAETQAEAPAEKIDPAKEAAIRTIREPERVAMASNRSHDVGFGKAATEVPFSGGVGKPLGVQGVEVSLVVALQFEGCRVTSAAARRLKAMFRT